MIIYSTGTAESHHLLNNGHCMDEASSTVLILLYSHVHVTDCSVHAIDRVTIGSNPKMTNGFVWLCVNCVANVSK